MGQTSSRDLLAATADAQQPRIEDQAGESVEVKAGAGFDEIPVGGRPAAAGLALVCRCLGVEEV